MKILPDFQIRGPSILRMLVLGNDARTSPDGANIPNRKRVEGLSVSLKPLTSKANAVMNFLLYCWPIEFIITYTIIV